MRYASIAMSERHLTMTEHKHGEMNIEVQQKTFDGMLKAMIRVSIVSIGLLIFIAIVNG